MRHAKAGIPPVRKRHIAEFAEIAGRAVELMFTIFLPFVSLFRIANNVRTSRHPTLELRVNVCQRF